MILILNKEKKTTITKSGNGVTRKTKLERFTENPNFKDQEKQKPISSYLTRRIS